MKTIILGSPKAKDGLVHHIEKKIREYGYNVVSLSFPINDWQYKSFTDRAINFLRKTILRDKTYKRLLKFKPFEKELLEQLDTIESADFALIIGTDIYPEYFIKKIKNKTKRMYAYQWDGLDVYPIAKQHIKYYDKFFVFDPNDLKYSKVFPQIFGLPNFFFETEIEDIIHNYPPHNEGNKIYYLGSYEKRRYQDLLKINEALDQIPFDISKNINLFVSSKIANSTTLHSDFKKITEVFSYRKNFEETYHSDIIIDLLSNHHNGLSFRPFEAIGFGKKLITTNKSIKNYDFYRPENIFIWGEDEDLETFILGEYQPLPQDIYTKYSFRNWLKNILEEDGKIPISLPK